MARPIYGLGFHGMNNIAESPAKLLDDKRWITPMYTVNVECTDVGSLYPRTGFAKQISLAGAHSLWGGSVMLVAAAGVLYRVDGVTLTALTDIDGPETRINYEEIDNLVYMSTPYWSAIYDFMKGEVHPWGVALPPAPTVGLVPGDLPPGTYSLCFTQVEHGRLSGNGPITTVSWDGDSQGIALTNLPALGQCWMTPPNGKVLLRASVTAGVVTGQTPQASPLPSFQAAPPGGMSDFCIAFGRVWGLQGKTLIYSYPFRYEWFKADTFIPFIEDLVLIAPVKEGIFVNSLESTWFLEGTDPSKIAISRIGTGAIPGTMTMANMPSSIVGGGFEMSRKLGLTPSPVWADKRGIVVGTQTGHVVHLTESRLRMTTRSRGASLYRMNYGRPQVIVSMSGASFQENPDIATFQELGSLF